MKILVSACLLGCSTRYDGKSKANESVLALAKKHTLIPICGEQMGGLTTPRKPSERRAGGVFMNDGTDVTENYRIGAENALKIAEINQVDLVILKSGSPSCGKGLIYDGTFTGNKIPGNGVTTDLLLSKGYTVITENEVEQYFSSGKEQAERLIRKTIDFHV